MQQETPCSRGSRILRWVAISAAAWLLLPLPLLAQGEPPFPRYEVGGGFAYTSLSAPGLVSRDDSVGAYGAFAVNVNRWFGLATEVSGQKEPECAQNDLECIFRKLTAPQLVRYSSVQWLSGPRLTRRGDRVDWFGHALFGLTRSKVTVLDFVAGTRTRVLSGPRFAMGFGGGMDWNVGPHLGIRLFQVDYIPVHIGAQWRHNIRVQAGAVIRFGGGQ